MHYFHALVVRLRHSFTTAGRTFSRYSWFSSDPAGRQLSRCCWLNSACAGACLLQRGPIANMLQMKAAVFRRFCVCRLLWKRCLRNVWRVALPPSTSRAPACCSRRSDAVASVAARTSCGCTTLRSRRLLALGLAESIHSGLFHRPTSLNSRAITGPARSSSGDPCMRHTICVNHPISKEIPLRVLHAA